MTVIRGTLAGLYGSVKLVFYDYLLPDIIMATVVKVEGFEAFQAKVAELSKTGGDIFVMFSGSKDANGVSWCPDCVDAEPVVNVGRIMIFKVLFSYYLAFQGCLSGAADDSHYLYVGVGGRSFWKDQNCVFRTAKETQLKR